MGENYHNISTFHYPEQKEQTPDTMLKKLRHARPARIRNNTNTTPPPEVPISGTRHQYYLAANLLFALSLAPKKKRTYTPTLQPADNPASRLTPLPTPRLWNSGYEK